MEGKWNHVLRGLSFPWGPRWDSPGSAGRDGLSEEKTLRGWGFLERGTL
jgi:hypothetical protein